MDFPRGGNILSAVSLPGVANNVTMIAAIANQRIRVFGWIIGGSGAGGGYVQFKDGNAGTLISGRLNFLGVASPDVYFPIQSEGVFETSPGVGLFMDVVTSSPSINLFYKVYTP